MFNPISASDKIRDEFVDYLSTDFFFKDQTLQRKFVRGLQKQISQGPFLEINDIYKTDKTMTDLINEGILSKRFLDLEKNSKYKKVLPLDRPLYKHQVNAITQIVNGNNVVVSTGTGSGKTNCFLIPVINELLKELDEKGFLDAGIRALFVFPVNALANDQIKNIRMLLMNYPEITFGVYNGSTEELDKSAEANYRATFMNSDIPELREKLPNEEISRNDMKNHPPHILFTNYAMLEYLLFRPTDRSLFENSHFKFIVLDEAHIYSGVVGIETSMLIRRLKTRLGSSDDVQFILTSATLGGSDEEIINFATNLSGAHFIPKNIVRGEREPQYLFACERNIYPSELIRKLGDENNYIPDVLNEYGILYDKVKYSSEDEFLYDFVFNSDLYYRLRSFGEYFDSDELSNQGIFRLSSIQDKLDIDDDTLVSFISLCTRAKKNGKQLLDAKFHFFIRTLEGCYISLDDDQMLSLVPMDHKGDDDQTRLFEVAVCRNCGEIALVGKIEDGFLVNKKKSEFGEQYFYLASTIDSDIEDGEDPEEDDTNFKAKEYLLCPKCGAISEYGINITKPSTCHCDECNPIKIISARVSGDDEEKHCYCHSCYSGHQRRFYIGNDGATSVLATSLYEALPKQKIIKKQDNNSQNDGKSHFFSSNSEIKTQTISQVGQFLTFSDSRQEAAKFASYLGKSYEDFLRRRGITQLINKYIERGDHKVRTISDYVHDLTKLFENTGCFKDEVSSSTSSNDTQAWVAMLNELGRHTSRNSLSSLGFLQFKYLGNYSKEMEPFIKEVASAYSVSEKTISDLLDLLIMELVNTGAVSTDGDFDIGDEQRQYIWYSKSQRYISLNYDPDASGTVSYWLPRKINGKYRKTKKLKYVMDALHISEDEAVSFLNDYFDRFLTSQGNVYCLKAGPNGTYTLPASCIRILLPGEEDAHWYRCEKCGRIQTSLIDGHCNYSKCGANIDKEISNPEILRSDNHFANLYQNGNMSSLVIKEHTAQLDRAQALKYQQEFINKKINVLSCSTTFEMGVDIGDLEAVFLRDMPPTPSNYNQRAGRAGRSIDSAAYVLSFAKLSSHDFYFFDRPMNMIAGTILPPFFKLDNVDIARRHIYATVLSEFFLEYPHYFNRNDGSSFMNGDKDEIRGYDVFCSWLNDKREKDDLDLKILLMSSIPDVGDFHEELGLNDYSWVDGLIGQDGILYKLMSNYDFNVSEFEELNDSLVEQLVTYSSNADITRKLKNNTDNLNRYKNKKLIDFLSRGGVLPRYGFPVDTVELEQYGGSSGNQLNLSRDLTMAISEYAPSSEVIADNHLYTSRYINKSLLDQKYGWKIDYIWTCPNPECNAKIFSVIQPDGDITCPYCGKKISKNSCKESIEPIAGFVADEKVKPVPMNRQERSYNAPISYIGDGNNVDTEIVGFDSGRTIELKSTKDDSLLVMSNEPFYVCKTCGYAVSTDESNPFPGEPIGNYRNALFAKGPYITTKVFKHKKTNGNECDCHDFTRYYLHHIFKTDVAKITFVDPPFIKPDEIKKTMYSVMYAIFNAIRYDFQIDKNDIGCCLSINHLNDQIIYSIIIYDQITGGSGYAKKIVKDGAASFKKIISDAYYNMAKCDCDPSCYKCLRSYENRMYHDDLDRRLAMKFLKNYIEEY